MYGVCTTADHGMAIYGAVPAVVHLNPSGATSFQTSAGTIPSIAAGVSQQRPPPWIKRNQTAAPFPYP